MTWWRAWGPWVVFTLAGPPLGFAAILLAGSVAALAHGKQISGQGFVDLVWFYFSFLVFAYLFGGLQATVVGVVASLSRTQAGYPAVIPPLAVATVVSIAMTAFVWRGGVGGDPLGTLTLLLTAHCGSTVLCWLLVRRLRYTPDVATEQP